MPGKMPESMTGNGMDVDPTPEPPKTPLVETMQALATTAIETPQLVKAELIEAMDRLSKMLLDTCKAARFHLLSLYALSYFFVGVRRRD